MAEAMTGVITEVNDGRPRPGHWQDGQDQDDRAYVDIKCGDGKTRRFKRQLSPWMQVGKEVDLTVVGDDVYLVDLAL
jgi:hypothetical protein